MTAYNCKVLCEGEYYTLTRPLPSYHQFPGHRLGRPRLGDVPRSGRDRTAANLYLLLYYFPEFRYQLR